ncbi:MAG: Clp protease N-terminal domain-containing protein [Aggregatilineales bacterium]
MISEPMITERCKHWLDAASDEAARLNHKFIGTEHLYIVLTKANGSLAQRLLLVSGLDPRSMHDDICRDAGADDTDQTSTMELPLTPHTRRVLSEAIRNAEKHQHKVVDERHLLYALLHEEQDVLVRRLQLLGVDVRAWLSFVEAELQTAQTGNDGITSTTTPMASGVVRAVNAHWQFRSLPVMAAFRVAVLVLFYGSLLVLLVVWWMAQ